MIRTFLILLLLATTATAQDLPALFNVTGVSANDSLNVRANPTTNAPVIGKLTHSAQNIEVVQTSQDGKWAQINIGETAGWTSMRYLTAQKTAFLPGQPLTCFGTEPFWSLKHHLNQTQSLTLKTPNGTRTFEWLSSLRSVNNTGHFAITASDNTSTLVSTLSRTLCNDGMSDRQYGIQINLILPQNEQHLSGCCTLTP